MDIRMIARICCFLRLHQFAYFLNRHRKRVITFHNVLSDDVFVRDVANGVSCSLSQFKTTIDAIAKRFKFSLDLDDCKSVTVTFDDGYANQATVAAPYLIERKIPAYIFVSGQLLDQRKVTLTIDKLLHWVSYAPNGKYRITVEGKDVLFTLNTHNRGEVWSAIIWPAFLVDSQSKGHDLFNALDSAYPYDSIMESLSAKYIGERLVGITQEQLEILKSHGWVVGWHTYSHYPVSKLLSAEKTRELTPGVDFDKTVMSFPFGGEDDVDEECLKIVRTSGFGSALSNVNMNNTLSGNFFRSRMSLSSDPALIDFELSGLKYFLKYKKLLPKT